MIGIVVYKKTSGSKLIRINTFLSKKNHNRLTRISKYFLQINREPNNTYQPIVDIPNSKLKYLKEKEFIDDHQYVEQLNNLYFTDISPSLWQTTTYYIATELARRFQSKYIIDLGCGKACKLSKVYPEFGQLG